MVRILWLLLFHLISITSTAQVNCFATARLNTTEVYPEQPIKVTIRVLTETWFTQPLDFETVIVPSAFVIPFKRTQSGIHYVNNKKYAGLEFFFLIYPYASGSYEFPEVTINVETPPIGDYKGQKIAVKTQPKQFNVLEIPEDYKGDQWFMAKNVRISDRWDKALDDIKVGDVFERRITIAAAGALPAFIPELKLGESDYATIYHKTPKLKDNRTKHDVNGVRVERNLYLFEKEGKYQIPSVRVEWWNPYARRLYYKELAAIEIQVKPNEDLGILLSVKDSLSTTQALVASDAEEGPAMWFGLIWWEFILVALGMLLIIFVLVRALHWTISSLANKRRIYLSSEQYYVRKIKSGLNAQDKINAVYDWLDRFHPGQTIEYPGWHQYLYKYFSGNNVPQDIDLSNVKLRPTSKNSKVDSGQMPID